MFSVFEASKFLCVSEGHVLNFIKEDILEYRMSSSGRIRYLIKEDDLIRFRKENRRAIELAKKSSKKFLEVVEKAGL